MRNFRSDRCHAAGRCARAVAVAVPLVLAATFTAAAGDAPTGDERKALEDVRQDLEETRADGAQARREAKRFAAELTAFKKRLVDIAGRAQELESRASKLEQSLNGLVAEETEIRRALALRKHQLGRTFTALLRMARLPPAALAALPATPSDTVRSALLLRHTVPQLEARAKALNGDLSRLAALRSQILRRRAEFTDALAALDHDRGTIDGLIRRKVDLERRARVRGRAAETRATKLAAQARDLGDLVDRLARANRRANKERRTLLARRRPPYRAIPGTGSTTDAVSIVPARGRIVRRFGQSDGSGGDTKGITIETRPAAQVVAPREGEVVFAGPFRGYGQLLIIAYGGGYHVLLAGMSRIDAAVGDKVLAGEPVGGMNSSSDAKPSLYLELRREGRPINPLPWLAASRSKVSG